MIHYKAVGRREIVAEFNGETITSNGGSLLLREIEQRIAIVSHFADSFTNYRDEKKQKGVPPA